MRFALITVVAALLVLAAASEVKFIPESLEHLSGLELCDLKEARIARISTIKTLIAAFESDLDVPCKHDWLEPLEKFQRVLDASAVDACGLETIRKIEDFHWYYVIGTLSKSWKEASEGSLPEPLRLFFIHFARETMERCASSVGQRLNEALSSSSIESTSLSGGSLGLMLRAASIAMVPKEKISKFDDFFFLFEAIINSERKKGVLVEETIPDPRTGEVTYMSVKLPDATKTRDIQERCRQQLRPVYANTVLPVMRLIDLGFGSKGQRFHEDEKVLAEWYEIAQFCEFLLPVKFYSSDGLKKGQVAMVRNQEEAQLLASQDQTALTRTASRIRVSAIQLEDAIPVADDALVVEQVKSGFKSRVRIYRKSLRNALSYLSGQLSSRFKKLFVSKKKNGKFVIDQDEAEIKKSLAEAEKNVMKDELEDRHPPEVVESAPEVAESRELADNHHTSDFVSRRPKNSKPAGLGKRIMVSVALCFIIMFGVIQAILQLFES